MKDFLGGIAALLCLGGLALSLELAEHAATTVMNWTGLDSKTNHRTGGGKFIKLNYLLFGIFLLLGVTIVFWIFIIALSALGLN